MVSAIGRLYEGFGSDLGSMLRSYRPLPVNHLMAMLKDAIAEHGLPIALVLDDFHLVEDPDLLAGVFNLATSGSGNLRVIVVSRTSPPWPLARLRAYGG
jgi:ATP/maltotriose-dependent transcriptional regulator MalT